MRLPEGSLPAAHGYRQLEGLDSLGQERAFGLVQKQMDMLRHDDIAGNREEIAQADALQRIFEEILGRSYSEVIATVETTEGEKVKVPRLLIADALAFHAPRGYSNFQSGCSGNWGHPPRSPKARDRGHPQLGWEGMVIPGPPATDNQCLDKAFDSIHGHPPMLIGPEWQRLKPFGRSRLLVSSNLAIG